MLIYVIEDDDSERDIFTKNLQSDKHEVVAFKDTLAAHNYFMIHTAPDAALIDFQFYGGPGGLSLARQLRAVNPVAAIIMTSCYASKEDIIEAFRNGIDDFLLKPVSAKVLAQSLGNAVIERRTKHPSDTIERLLGSLIINPNTYQVWWQGQEIRLTHSEFRLLLHITSQPGHIFNYAELYAACTGEHVSPSQAAKKLTTHVFNLKHKFTELALDIPCPIVNRRGDGIFWHTDS